MKQTDIRPCSKCGKGVMHDGHVLFYRVKIESMVVDMGAIRQQHGLEMMLGGNAALAYHMGPQRDMAAVAATHELILCMPCMLSMGQLLALAQEDEPEEENPQT